jgi:hypothetical protein
MAHSAKALQLRKDLNRELTSVAQQSGQDLVWSTAEAALIERAMATVDRLQDLQRDYKAAETPKQRVAISTEIRLCDGQLERLLRRIKPEPQKAPETLTTIKNRAAANVRWQRERDRNAAAAGE